MLVVWLEYPVRSSNVIRQGLCETLSRFEDDEVISVADKDAPEEPRRQ